MKKNTKEEAVEQHFQFIVLLLGTVVEKYPELRVNKYHKEGTSNTRLEF